MKSRNLLFKNMPSWFNDFEFNSLNISKLQNISGIYAIKELNYNVIYIGKGDPIKDRLIFHASNQETNILLKKYLSQIKCLFCYSPIPKEEDRIEWEKYYIDRYKPVCNTQNK